MGNSMFASMFANFSHVSSTGATHLVPLLLTGLDFCTSSFDLLVFLCGRGDSNSAADVEGMFLISSSSLVYAISVSSSIRVPIHFGEDAMVKTSTFYYVIIAPTTSASTITASNAAPISASTDGAPKSSIPSIGFVAAASSPDSYSWLLDFVSSPSS